MSDFQSLGLPTVALDRLAQIGFVQPTPIQARAIPVALAGHDILACAETGTGKTAAFCLPIFTRLREDKQQSGALVLVPTRELAIQIQLFWKSLTAGAPELEAVLLIGGVPLGPQARALRRSPRMIIATPGRLLDHLGQRVANLSQTRFLVLDEADRMLDFGFEPQLSRILPHLPRDRQTLLFSATLTPEAERVGARFLRSPQRVSVAPVSKPAALIDQNFRDVGGAGKMEALLDEINRLRKQAPDSTVLIFAATQRRTDRVAKFLGEYGLDVGKLHGGRSQGQRNTALGSFRDGSVRILVATDIAARGIDVTAITYVINFDLPRMAEDYVHRIGRTGRAGVSGEAISFVAPEDRAQWRKIALLLKKVGAGEPRRLPDISAEFAAERPARRPAPSPGRTSGTEGGGARVAAGGGGGGGGTRSWGRRSGSGGGGGGGGGGRRRPR